MSPQTPSSHMNGGTVLYIEDEEFDVFFMRRAFAQFGLEESLRVVVDGQQAMDYLAGNAPYADRKAYPVPAVVLLDLNLPIVSGFQVLTWMREQPQLERLPVVVLSSSARPEDITRATELGANEYLQKPASGLHFADVVAKLKTKWLH